MSEVERVPRHNGSAPLPEAPAVVFHWDRPEPELTITHRQNRFEIQPASFTIPVALLDVLFAMRLNQELARRGIRIGTQALPGGVPPNTPA